MRIYRTDIFPLPLPEGHRFPAEKYAMLARRLVDGGTLAAGVLRVPREATREELLRVHTRDYLQRLEQGRMTPAEMRRIGLPWSTELFRRACRSVGATVESTVGALDDGVAISLAGGTHHAFADRGEGYCLLNDVAVAARAIQATERVKRILVIDADVHQGNGTAAIFRSDPSVFTFSIHGMYNFPLQKQASDLDVGLPDGTGDDAYLEALNQGLTDIARRFAPELVVYLAGADPHRNDRYGHMALTKQGLAERDRQVLAFCRRHGSPVAVTMAGGYGRNTVDTVDIHLQTVKIFYNHGNGNRPSPKERKP